MKWGTLYPAVYVNVLYRACRAAITGQFRFVCLTDNAEGLLPEVEAFAIPDLGLTDFDWKKGGWPKLTVFAADLYGLTGRALFIDLDTVVCGGLDEMFTHPGEIAVIDTGPNWRAGHIRAPQVAGTGIFAFTLGAHPWIVENFAARPQHFVAQYRIEQIYLQGEFHELAFWPLPWVASFKYHQRRPVGVGLVLPPRPPAPETKVIAFHGEPRPIDLIRPGIWGIPPNVGRGRVRWMVDYWRRFGGDPEHD